MLSHLCEYYFKETKMNLKMHSWIISLLFGTLFLGACSQDNNNNAITEENTEDLVAEVIVEEENEEEEEEFIPEASQQMTEFPWDEDEAFRSAQSEHEPDELIAGYTTVFDVFPPEEEENVRLAASIIQGTVLEPGENFSQNEIAGPYTEEKGYKEGDVYVSGEVMKDFGGGVCNVATTLYNAAIASNLEIVERHNHSMPVPYVPYGQDAAVAYGFKDFQFKNDTEHPMLIWTELVDNRLYVGFYGKEAAPEIVWEHDVSDETATDTQYIVNPDLAEGEENVLVEGMDGKVVDSILKVKHADGEEERKELGQSVYNPLHHLIEKAE